MSGTAALHALLAAVAWCRLSIGICLICFHGSEIASPWKRDQEGKTRTKINNGQGHNAKSLATLEEAGEPSH